MLWKELFAIPTKGDDLISHEQDTRFFGGFIGVVGSASGGARNYQCLSPRVVDPGGDIFRDVADRQTPEVRLVVQRTSGNLTEKLARGFFARVRSLQCSRPALSATENRRTSDTAQGVGVAPVRSAANPPDLRKMQMLFAIRIHLPPRNGKHAERESPWMKELVHRMACWHASRKGGQHETKHRIHPRNVSQ